MFNEVFLTDARVADDAIIGGLNNGWAVANTTLMNERAGLGTGGGSAAGSTALSGTIGGHLPMRAGDFVAGGKSARNVEGGLLSGGSAKMYFELAKKTGASKDSTIRQELVRLYSLGEIGRFNGLRLKAAKEAGSDIPGMPNISKLSMSQTMRMSRDLGLQIIGPQGMLHAYDPESRTELSKATGHPEYAFVTEIALFAQAPSIYGGTDQVQRNIIGERVLGLPKEPNDDRTRPFSELPKNT
jgi:alkylation response protein AidB-like acyl-CoA dehydrogenase